MYAELVRSEPFRHSSLWASLAEPCAIDILSVVRSVECEVLRSAVDCSMLEIPLLDLKGKLKLLRPLGKKKLEASLSAQGLAGFARWLNLRLNLRTWSELVVRFNLVVGWVVGLVSATRSKDFVWASSCLNPNSKKRIR
jgi:hypothetical protein